MKTRISGIFESAMDKEATSARIHWSAATSSLIFAASILAGCSALPDKPTRSSMYDFGPGLVASQPSMQQAALPPLPPIALDDITTAGGALDNMAVLYRLGYDDAQHLRPYSLARWSMPPSLLVRQRMRDQLGKRRAVFNAGESAALNRSQNPRLPLLLHVNLEEFSQLFSSPNASAGLVRLRVTLVEVTAAGERLIGQRSVAVQRPADTADAPGGVRALTAATDAAIEEIDQWLQQTPAR